MAMEGRISTASALFETPLSCHRPSLLEPRLIAAGSADDKGSARAFRPSGTVRVALATNHQPNGVACCRWPGPSGRPKRG